MVSGLFVASGDVIVIFPLYVPVDKPVAFMATEKVVGVVLLVLETTSHVVNVLTVIS
jgi:hypothetical protein